MERAEARQDRVWCIRWEFCLPPSDKQRKADGTSCVKRDEIRCVLGRDHHVEIGSGQSLMASWLGDSCCPTATLVELGTGAVGPTMS